VNGDQYVASVIGKYAVNAAPGSAASQAANQLFPALRSWAGRSLLGIQFSGSYAKHTAISLGTDVDLFISLDSTQPVKEIYWSLYRFCGERGWGPQVQNVSVRVQSNGLHVDLVPGRKQDGNTEDHTLYKRKKDSWVQTNVMQHIRLIANSGRRDEIRALKIWRERNRLDFPSFYLELTVLEALKYSRMSSLAARFSELLQYLAGEGKFNQARVVDPANSNNIISDDLGPEEKRGIVVAAEKCLAIGMWEQTLW
jgi:hypothetical protein